MLHLIVIELAKVLHIYLSFFCIYYCGKSVEFHMVKVKVLYGLNDVAQLTNP